MHYQLNLKGTNVCSTMNKYDLSLGNSCYFHRHFYVKVKTAMSHTKGDFKCLSALLKGAEGGLGLAQSLKLNCHSGCPKRPLTMLPSLLYFIFLLLVFVNMELKPGRTSLQEFKTCTRWFKG